MAIAAPIRDASERRALLAGRGLVSTRALGLFVQSELAGRGDIHFAVRNITNEISRWHSCGLSLEELRLLTESPPDSGDPRFDALIEGIVAHKFHGEGYSAPDWCQNTKLEETWAPFGDVIIDDDWYLMGVLLTPVELLDKRIVFNRSNLNRQ